jgi:hypothetical protein
MLGSGLAEGERVGLGAGGGEGDLDGAVGDGAGVADELVQPLLRDGAVAVAVDVGSVGLGGWLPSMRTRNRTGVPGAAGP